MNNPPSNGGNGGNGQPPSGPGSGQQGKPFVRILEQPAKCAIRFRYECEGRSAGSIPGVTSTAENKVFPTIQVCNYHGKAVVVVSCVTKDGPYRPHPHNLVGKEGCKKGVCTIVIDNNPEMTCTFTSLGIQCVKRKDIEDSLKLRELIKVDPFRTGFNHRTQASSIDLNVVRLCFQVFIEGPEKGKFTVQLPPIVSEAIYDKKAMAELIINKLSHYSAPCTGGKEIILLCDRVAKDDIQVRFYHETPDACALLWEAYGEFLPNDVHKQVAISLRTPKYFDESIQQPVTIQIQLRRPSDGCTSLSRSFQLTPRELDPDGLVRKRHKRIKEENYDLLQEYISLAGVGGGAGASSASGQTISGSKRSASISFGGKTTSTTPGSPKKDLAALLLQQQQQGASPTTRPQPHFVQFGGAGQNPAGSLHNDSSNSPKSASPSAHQQIQFLPIQQSPSYMTYTEQQADPSMVRAATSSPSYIPCSSGQQQQQQQQQKSRQTPNHHASSYTTPEILGPGPSNMVFTIIPPGSSPNPAYQLYQQPLPSPNPSVASYSSSVPSPGGGGPHGGPYSMQSQLDTLGPAEPVPTEVVERFDSLDIDSSELIPDLEFNSNTMLNLMMDTSSGLSLTDSFSDITNGNAQEQALKMSKSYGNGDVLYTGTGSFRPGSRSKLKLSMGGSNPAMGSNLSGGNLDTPTIEMVNSLGASCGFGGGQPAGGQNLDPLLSVLDVDNNNLSLH